MMTLCGLAAWCAAVTLRGLNASERVNGASEQPIARRLRRNCSTALCKSTTGDPLGAQGLTGGRNCCVLESVRSLASCASVTVAGPLPLAVRPSGAFVRTEIEPPIAITYVENNVRADWRQPCRVQRTSDGHTRGMYSCN